MVEKLTYIELGDCVYPMKCDLAVLEIIQEEYGTINKFEKKLIGEVEQTDQNTKEAYTEPSVKAVRFALPLMINEGIDIENLKEGEKRKHITENELNEMMSEFNLFEIARKLHDEFVRCFITKNRRSTQKPEKTQK